MSDQTPEAQPLSTTVDQRAFLSALGINPETVMANSIQIGFGPDGTAIVQYTTVAGVTPQALGMAFLAGGGMLGGGAGAESEPVEEGTVTDMRTKAGRRTAAKKTTAKKTAAPKKDQT